MIKNFVRRTMPEMLLAHLQAADHYLQGEPEIRLLPRLCDRTKVSLDIGANIGTYTYFMRRHSRQVRAYEPNPELATRLQRLFPDVTVRQAAVSDKPGELFLRIPIEDGIVQHELASVTQCFDEPEEIVEYAVPAVQIDNEGLTDVGFMKIDVERHEIPVLKGSMRTIAACAPVIMTEVTPLLYPCPLPEVFEFLTEVGYAGWFKFEGQYLPLSQFVGDTHANPAQFGRQFMDNNVIFLPPGFDDSFLERQ